jgi:hypothetical protein
MGRAELREWLERTPNDQFLKTKARHFDVRSGLKRENHTINVWESTWAGNRSTVTTCLCRLCWLWAIKLPSRF